MSSRLPEIRAVVFDLDGLMLNTEDVFDLSGRRLLERRGLQMTDEIHHSMLGRRPTEAFTVLKALTGITDEIADLMQESKQLFAEIAENHLTTMPGLHDLLTVLDAKQLPKAVATSSPRGYMTELLTRFELLQHFPVTLTAEDVTHGKPHPEIYLMAAKLLQVEPSQMLVLEDSETGTRAAAAAGAFTVSVPNRHTAVGNFSMSSMRVSSLHDTALLQLLHQL